MITIESHRNWMIGFDAYADGLPCPTEPGQAAGWRAALVGSNMCNGIDDALSAGYELDSAEEYALLNLENAIAREEEEWNRQMMAGI